MWRAVEECSGGEERLSHVQAHRTPAAWELYSIPAGTDLSHSAQV